MTTHHEGFESWLAQRFRDLASRVRQDVRGASCNVSQRVQGAQTHFCASALATPSSEALDLCVEVHDARDGGGTVVSADLVVGGTGDVLATLAPISLSPGEYREGSIPMAIVEFVDAQETHIVWRLHESLESAARDK